MNDQQRDDDGDLITLTEDDRVFMAGEIADIDAELKACENDVAVAELNRMRRHLMLELDAGRRLPMQDEPNTESGQGIGPSRLSLLWTKV